MSETIYKKDIELGNGEFPTARLTVYYNKDTKKITCNVQKVKIKRVEGVFIMETMPFDRSLNLCHISIVIKRKSKNIWSKIFDNCTNYKDSIENAIKSLDDIPCKLKDMVFEGL